MKYKVGDKVRIIAQKYGHEHKIGEIVTITYVNERSTDYHTNAWYVREDEIELVTKGGEK